ncbi:MAG TPA: DUF4003 family protein [Feifaniaceae bacterium]|nr:DUF4003 family protein [Feifaniaceae bacterium]
MTSALCETIQLFIKNTEAAKDEFPFQSAMMRRTAALLYAGEGRALDRGRVRDAMRLIKANTGAFSMFRGAAQLGLAAMVSLDAEPEKLLKETLLVYRLLKSNRFPSSMHLVFAAYQIAKTVPQDARQEAVKKAGAMYGAVRRAHPFLAGEQSIIYAALVGSFAKDAEEAAVKTERLYIELSELSPRGELLNLSMLLSLSDGMDISSRVLKISDALKAESLEFGRHFLLPMLGVFALSPLSPNFIAANIAEAASSLRAQKGFGPLFVQKRELLLLSSSLVICAQPGGREPLNAALLGGLTGMLIAQQVAVAGAAGAAAAAAAASSASS